MNSIYVCHTYYHVFVTMLKELNKPAEERGKATLVLSRMSNDFEDFKARAEKSGVFAEVIEFDEKRDTFFPELAPWRCSDSWTVCTSEKLWEYIHSLG